MAAKTKTVTRYVKAKPKRRGKKSFTLPLMLLAGFAPLVAASWRGYKAGGAYGGVKELTLWSTGYYIEDGKFYPGYMSRGVMPVVAGFALHWLAKRLGVNRMLGRAGVPLLRV